MPHPGPRNRPGANGLNGRALTGLRGVAAMMIVAHHYALLQRPPVPILHGFVQGSYLAVDLFFVLSGYVMSLAYGRWFPAPRGVAGLAVHAQFIARRLARIWPLHAVVTLLLLAREYEAGQWAAWPTMIACNLLLVQSWGISQSINPPSWSISAEFAAYLLFPFLCAFVLHGQRGRAWLALAGAAGLLVLAVALAPDRPFARRGALDVYNNWSTLPMLRCLGGFTVGIVLFRVTGDARAARVLRHPWCGPAAGTVALACLGLRAPDLLTYFLLPVLVAAVHLGQGRLQRALASPLLHGLGVLSYALYLVHYPVIAAFPPGALPEEGGFAICVALSLVMALLAHVLVERPARQALRRMAGSMQARLMPAALR